MARLTFEEECDLARRAQEGDIGARNELVEANLGLVILASRRFRDRGVPAEDLRQEGQLGLMRAAESFDPGRGRRFATHAGWWIEEAMHQAVYNTGSLVRLPQYVAKNVAKLKRMRQGSMAAGKGEPSFDEVADSLGWSEGERRHAWSGLVCQSAESHRLPDFACGELAEPEEDRRLDMVLGEIGLLEDDRQSAVLMMRYGLSGGEPMKFGEIARRLGLSREWIRLLHGRAMAEIRGQLGIRGDSDGRRQPGDQPEVRGGQPARLDSAAVRRRAGGDGRPGGRRDRGPRLDARAQVR